MVDGHLVDTDLAGGAAVADHHALGIPVLGVAGGPFNTPLSGDSTHQDRLGAQMAQYLV